MSQVGFEHSPSILEESNPRVWRLRPLIHLTAVGRVFCFEQKHHISGILLSQVASLYPR